MQSWQKVLIGMLLGIITGLLFGSEISSLAYLGIFFLNMIKMVTVPLIFFTIIYGITSVEHYSGLGRISAKAIIIFLCTALVAACIGLVVSSVIKPGAGDNQNKILKMISESDIYDYLVAAKIIIKEVRNDPTESKRALIRFKNWFAKKEEQLRIQIEEENEGKRFKIRDVR